MAKENLGELSLPLRRTFDCTDIIGKVVPKTTAKLLWLKIASNLDAQKQDLTAMVEAFTDSNIPYETQSSTDAIFSAASTTKLEAKIAYGTKY